jgi:hypothetical protein
MLRPLLVCAAVVGCFGFGALALPADKKTDLPKVKDDGKAKSKEIDKPKTPTEKSKLPDDTIAIVVDNVLDAMGLFPKSVTMSLDKYIELKDRIKVLERQLKTDKKIPFSCRLEGKLDGDFVVLRAQFVFSTELPKTTVLLGLGGGHLLDEGDLEGQTPILDFNKDEGFRAIIEKEAKEHHLTLNVRVPVQTKKSAAGSIERCIELGMPGTPLTQLTLEMPGGVKELRCNEILEKTKTPGRWQLGLAAQTKSLSLAWKEPLTLPGNAPLVKVEGQISAVVDEKDVQITAELFLEDRRSQTKDWKLVLPPQVTIDDVSVTAPGGLTSTLSRPTSQTPYYVLHTSETTAERWQVTVAMKAPRPTSNAKVKIGPFYVLGAFQQTGTITVKMKPDASLGQRLIATRADGVTQHKNTEAETNFQYDAPPINEKNVKAAKAPLELEWRTDKNQVETQVTHELMLQTVNEGWDLETTSRIQMKTRFPGIKVIDLRLPSPRPSGVAVIGMVSPGLAFPGNMPWAQMWKLSTHGNRGDFVVLDELNTPLKPIQDGAGKVRIFLDANLGAKPTTIVVKNKIRIPAASRRLHLELPQPLNTRERAGKITLQTDERIELQYGPEGAEEPVPDHQQFAVSFDQSPAFVDLVWRPYRRESVAPSTLDIFLHEHTAEVKQVLRIPRDQGFGAKDALIVLKLPAAITRKPGLSGGKIISHSSTKQTLVVDAQADAELVLSYDLDITPDRLLHVTPIGLASASQMDVKIRVWSAAGGKVALVADQRGSWKERSIEIVPGKEQFPALILQGYGANLPLTLEIGESASPALAAFVVDRSLIQVHTFDDGSQQVRARYLIRKVPTGYLDVELPLPVSRFHEKPIFKLGTFALQANPTDKDEKSLRVKLPVGLVVMPTVLEISYTIPFAALDQNSFWRTTLYAPTFLSPAVIGQMRWQLTTPTRMIAASLGRDVRPDTKWSWQNCLRTPEPSYTTAELESWLTDEPSQSTLPVTFGFAHISMQPETVYHLPRQWWLLGCSGVLLIVTLGGYLSPLPRWAFWLMPLGLAVLVLVLALFCPAVVAPILFGLQPGVVLLLVFVGIHWFMHERYRRKLIFLPGFAQAKPGSTMVRNDSATRPRQGSTVDAPAASAAPTETAAQSSGSAS